MNDTDPDNDHSRPKTEKEMQHTPLMLNHIDTSNRHRISLILDEFLKGFRFLQQYNRTVSFFGSARTTPDHDDYQRARTLARRVVTDCDHAIVTGGGPGIMEAANRGACDADGRSLGLTIRLPEEQTTNEFVRESVDFHYFFVRKVMLAFCAEAYVFFPGGFGTMDELFELLTLVQTNKIAPIPIFLIDHGYWQQYDSFIRHQLYENRMIDEEDMDIYTITDDEEYVLDTIRNTPTQETTPLDQ